MEEGYLLCHAQRTEYRSAEIGSPPGAPDPMNEGTVYTLLMRLQQRKWIASEGGTSENNRKAKYYSITKSGRKQLARET
jgi:predicted transcriptional regulator